jgi:two-component system sensor histidine kinase/response regulator
MAKILVVDDEEVIRRLYNSILSEVGHEIFVAEDAEKAKSILSKEEFDVAVVDRILPGQEDGVDILKLIQAKYPLCQIIMLSGFPTFSSASEAIRCRAFDYLTKPVKAKKLCEVVNAALKEKSLQEEQALSAEKNKKSYEEMKSKQEMLHHDMRSLLIGIIGFTNLLVNRTALDDDQLGYCKQIQKCSIQLEDMVNTYLDISHLEQPHFQPNKTEFDFLDLARQSRKTLHFLADEKNVEISMIYNKKMLSIEDVLSFKGDRVYLQNAMDNLLKNAIEASPLDRRVKIKIKNANSHIWVAVQNWGTIPSSLRSTFFEKYTTSGKRKGMGIGTYMANLVVKAHGGEINFESSEDKGTEVLIKLPLPSG